MTTIVEQSDAQLVSICMSLMPDELGLSPVALEVHYLVPFREFNFTYLAKVVTTLF